MAGRSGKARGQDMTLSIQCKTHKDDALLMICSGLGRITTAVCQPADNPGLPQYQIVLTFRDGLSLSLLKRKC